ncbi:MAG: IS200/IS605 family transposase [Bacteroidota bacterium]
MSSWKDVMVIELNVQKDHVHMVCSASAKLSFSDYMGLLKGKLAIKMLKTYPELKRKPYWGNHFWSRRFGLSTLVVTKR